MKLFPTVLSIGHLIDLVASDQDDPQKVLEKSFDWEHGRAVEVAKWLLALSSSIFAGLAAISFSKQFQADVWIYVGFKYQINALYVLIFIAVIVALIGIAALVSAHFLQRRYIESSALLARISEIKPFMMRLRREGLV